MRYAKEMGICGNVVSVWLGAYSLSLAYFGLPLRHVASTSSTPTVLILGFPAKLVSLSLFPAFSLGWLALSIYWAQPQLHALADTGVPISNLQFATIQSKCVKLLNRVNVSRMLNSIFAVLYLWRMGTFYRRAMLKAEGGHPPNPEDEAWLEYTKWMAGLGLLAALVNTLLYHRLQLTYRHLKQALKLRIKRSS